MSTCQPTIARLGSTRTLLECLLAWRGVGKAIVDRTPNDDEILSAVGRIMLDFPPGSR